VDDAIAIALEGRADRILRLLAHAALAVGAFDACGARISVPAVRLLESTASSLSLSPAKARAFGIG
jgi:hypothetical protein